MSWMPRSRAARSPIRPRAWARRACAVARLPVVVGAPRRAAPDAPRRGARRSATARRSTCPARRASSTSPATRRAVPRCSSSRRGALIVGDAFATYAVTTGEHGPQIAPFTADRRQALASLARLEDLDAQLCCPATVPPGATASARPSHGSARRRSSGARSRSSRRPASRRRGSAPRAPRVDVVESLDAHADAADVGLGQSIPEATRPGSPSPWRRP